MLELKMNKRKPKPLPWLPKESFPDDDSNSCATPVGSGSVEEEKVPYIVGERSPSPPGSEKANYHCEPGQSWSAPPEEERGAKSPKDEHPVSRQRQEKVRFGNKNRWEFDRPLRGEGRGHEHARRDLRIERGLHTSAPSANVQQTGLEHISDRFKECRRSSERQWDSSFKRNEPSSNPSAIQKNKEFRAEPQPPAMVNRFKRTQKQVPTYRGSSSWSDGRRQHPSPRYARTEFDIEDRRGFSRAESWTWHRPDHDYHRTSAGRLLSSPIRRRSYDSQSKIGRRVRDRAVSPEYERTRPSRGLPRSISYREDLIHNRDRRAYEDSLSVVSEPTRYGVNKTDPRWRRHGRGQYPEDVQPYSGWSRKSYQSSYKYDSYRHRSRERFQPSTNISKAEQWEKERVSSRENGGRKVPPWDTTSEGQDCKIIKQQEQEQLSVTDDASCSGSPESQSAKLEDTKDKKSRVYTKERAVNQPVENQIQPMVSKLDQAENKVTEEKCFCSSDKIVSFSSGDRQSAGAVGQPVDNGVATNDKSFDNTSDNKTYCLFRGKQYPLDFYNNPNEENKRMDKAIDMEAEKLDVKPKVDQQHVHEDSEDKWFPMNNTSEKNSSSLSQQTYHSSKESHASQNLSASSPSQEDCENNSEDGINSPIRATEKVNEQHQVGAVSSEATEDLWKSKPKMKEQNYQKKLTKVDGKKSSPSHKVTKVKMLGRFRYGPQSLTNEAIEARISPNSQNSSFYRPPPSVGSRKQSLPKTEQFKISSEEIKDTDHSKTARVNNTKTMELKHSERNSKALTQRQAQRPKKALRFNVYQQQEKKVQESNLEKKSEVRSKKTSPKKILNIKEKSADQSIFNYPSNSAFSMEAIKKSLNEERARKQEMKEKEAKQRANKSRRGSQKIRRSDKHQHSHNRSSDKEVSHLEPRKESLKETLKRGEVLNIREACIAAERRSRLEKKANLRRNGKAISVEKNGGATSVKDVEGISQGVGNESPLRTAWVLTRKSGFENKKTDLNQLFRSLSTNLDQFRDIMEDHVKELNLKIMANGSEIKKIGSFCEKLDEFHYYRRPKDAQLCVQRSCAKVSFLAESGYHGFEHRQW